MSLWLLLISAGPFHLSNPSYKPFQNISISGLAMAGPENGLEDACAKLADSEFEDGSCFFLVQAQMTWSVAFQPLFDLGGVAL